MDSEKIFTDLIRSIERRRSEVTQLIRDQEKAEVSRAEEQLKRLEQEIEDLRRRNTELEQLSQTDDHIHFLQVTEIWWTEQWSLRREEHVVQRLCFYQMFVSLAGVSIVSLYRCRVSSLSLFLLDLQTHPASLSVLVSVLMMLVNLCLIWEKNWNISAERR